MESLKGKVGVVTGAGSGIGLGIARQFAREGMMIALLERRAETLDAAAAHVRELGGKALPLVVDVTDFEDETWLDRAGDFHSTDMHVVERWKFLDANTIDYKATIEDPQVFSRPWDIEVFLYRHREKDFQLIENYCFTLDYDKYYPVPTAQ